MTAKRLDIHNSDVPVLCQSCEARHKGLCGALNAEELVELARHTRVVREHAGAELAAEGMPVDAYANVMQGVVKLSKVLEDGRQQIVGLQFAPDFLGRLYNTESAVTAEAASQVQLCKVPRSALERLLENNPALEHRLMQQVLRELDEAREWMVTLGRKTASEKVASFLLVIATHIDPNSQGEPVRVFDLPMTRADIADFLGLTIETVSRQMSKLRADRIIAITANRHVEILNHAGLRARTG
jgi:CRP/FNR family transcriptional regulator, anaerobic regulatory protein